MLSQERKRIILNTLYKRKTITVVELMDILKASESTIRRDLSEMDQKGLLKKVHGGAISLNDYYLASDETTITRANINAKEKNTIAKYAASLISDDDVVYLDASTTVALMIDYLKNSNATYITNCISHAIKLSKDNHNVYIVGGMIKANTEAIIGNDAYKYLEKINFTKGFLGANGIDLKKGCTTPDPQEASLKGLVLNNCLKKYILADNSKFDKICATTFAKMDTGLIITNNNIPEDYQKLGNVITVS